MKGIPASAGIGLAKPLVMKALAFDTRKRIVTQYELEIARLDSAIEATRKRMLSELARLDPSVERDAYGIQQAHLSMLDDPELLDGIRDCIENEHVCCEYAVDKTATILMEELRSINDELISARAADLGDVASELLQTLTNCYEQNAENLLEDVIVVAHEVTPSFIISANKVHLKGIVCEEGSTTSHIAILCRAYGIPAVFGVQNAVQRFAGADLVFVNGTVGEVDCEVSPDRQQQIETQLASLSALKSTLLEYRDAEGLTRDGRRVVIAANIGGSEDAQQAEANGAEGVGLFRTEFMYMECPEPPSEEYQYDAYTKVLNVFGGKEVTIRTLDAGGDKSIPGLVQSTEQNPFLGVRAIRLCLNHEDLFLTQLRALLRAAVHHNLRIMIPMVSCVTELRQTRQLLAKAAAQLEAAGVEYAKDVKLGAMIEVPSAAICADLLAKEADFFSIGTNDLTQYILAADRNNQELSGLYSEFHPAVLRSIASVVKRAHEYNIPVCVCGEFAANPLATALLVGMGVDELSVSPSAILKLKRILRCFSIPEAEQLVQKTLELQTAEEIHCHMLQAIENAGLSALLLV